MARYVAAHATKFQVHVGMWRETLDLPPPCRNQLRLGARRVPEIRRRTEMVDHDHGGREPLRQSRHHAKLEVGGDDVERQALLRKVLNAVQEFRPISGLLPPGAGDMARVPRSKLKR